MSSGYERKDEEDEDERSERSWTTEAMEAARDAHPVVQDNCRPNILTRRQFVSTQAMDAGRELLPASADQKWRSFAQDGTDSWAGPPIPPM